METNELKYRTSERLEAAAKLSHAMAHVGRGIQQNEEEPGTNAEWLAYRILGALSELVNTMALLPELTDPSPFEICDCQLCREYRDWCSQRHMNDVEVTC